VEPALAESMLSGLMSALGNDDTADDSPDGGDGTDGGDNGDADDADQEEEEEKEEESGLGAADTASVVKTLAVVANNVPPEVLADPKNQDNILSAINDFAGQDDDFVSDAGSDTAKA